MAYIENIKKTKFLHSWHMNDFTKGLHFTILAYDSIFKKMLKIRRRLTQASSTYAIHFYLREPEADLAWVKKVTKYSLTQAIFGTLTIFCSSGHGKGMGL